MTTFLQQLVNGISLGSIYALIALGYTMVYGVLRLINFAHGDVYMLGAYVGYYLSRRLKGDEPSLVNALLACSGDARLRGHSESSSSASLPTGPSGGSADALSPRSAFPVHRERGATRLRPDPKSSRARSAPTSRRAGVR